MHASRQSLGVGRPFCSLSDEKLQAYLRQRTLQTCLCIVGRLGIAVASLVLSQNCCMGRGMDGMVRVSMHDSIVCRVHCRKSLTIHILEMIRALACEKDKKYSG
jgi:hypothetical protein